MYAVNTYWEISLRGARFHRRVRQLYDLQLDRQHSDYAA